MTYVFIWILGGCFTVGLVLAEPPSKKTTLMDKICIFLLAYLAWPVVSGLFVGLWMLEMKKKNPEPSRIP